MEVTAILTIVKAVLASGWTKASLAMLATWVLGYYSESSWYQAVRRAIGKAVFAAFAAISHVGETKLGKVLWGNIEKVLVDVIFVFGEQSTAGLRSDNIEKLEDHLDRLKDVDSVTRTEAIEMKLDLLRHPGSIVSSREAAELARLNIANTERAKDALKEP